MNIHRVFFPPRFLSSPYYASHGLSPLWVHCSLDSLVGTKTGTRHSCLLCCITHCLAVPARVSLLVHQNIVDDKLLCQQREQCFLSSSFFSCCWRLFSELGLHYIFRKSPWRVIFGALHAGLVSLVTGLWFLHSGWPPWAASCRQIAVGWQISSSAPLICAVGPLA